jgi:hypothetical protein
LNVPVVCNLDVANQCMMLAPRHLIQVPPTPADWDC